VTDIDLVRSAILAMPIARTLQLRFVRLATGQLELEMPIQPSLCFREGQLQASAVYAIADFAAVGAAATLLPDGGFNATVDGSIKLFAPARGTHLRAVGRVVSHGRHSSVCAAEVHAIDGGRDVHCATLLATARNHLPGP
jgi:uncharacterized protein (TIGR00369 family)